MTALYSCHLALVTSNLRVADPLWLIALLLVPAALWLRGRRAVPVLLVPFAAAWHRPSAVSPSRWRPLFVALALVLLTVALARPQRIEDKREVHTQGYDLILAIDLSSSMRAEDYEKDGERLNRLQAIKPVLQSFITQRPNDRIGIVVFSGRAYTLAPLTFDHDWLAAQVGRLKIGLIEDGTAIGDGLGIALTRLEQAARESNGRRQGAFVILLTDGANNRGALSPEQAADIAKSRNIPVYTVGAGKDGVVPMPVIDDHGNKVGYTRMISDLDEGALRRLATATGGQFFRADDIHTAEAAFQAIDQTQKIEFQSKSYVVTTELFAWLAGPGLACMALAAITTRPRAARPAPAAAA